MLSYEDTLKYLVKAKSGDEKAKQIIFENNSPLIKSIIKKFKNKGVEYDDLFQIASIGLVKAIKNFDLSFNVRFSTYCVPMVIGEIKRYIRDNGAIKVSRPLKILANKINRFIDEYTSKNNDSPSITMISQEFNITEEEVVIALDSSKMPLYIFDKFDDEDEGIELIEKIPICDNEDKMIDKIHLSDIIDALSDKERKIITMRYFRDKTQSEIASELGVSQVQISRLESKILLKIKESY